MDKTIYKNISISKIKDVAEVNTKLPTHTINVSDEKFENRKDAGSLWTREGQYGKFLSGTMRKTQDYKDKEGVSKTRQGYSIISDEYLNYLINNIEGDTLNIQDDLNIPF